MTTFAETVVVGIASPTEPVYETGRTPLSELVEEKLLVLSKKLLSDFGEYYQKPPGIQRI